MSIASKWKERLPHYQDDEYVRVLLEDLRVLVEDALELERVRERFVGWDPIRHYAAPTPGAGPTEPKDEFPATLTVTEIRALLKTERERCACAVLELSRSSTPDLRDAWHRAVEAIRRLG